MNIVYGVYYLDGDSVPVITLDSARDEPVSRCGARGKCGTQRAGLDARTGLHS